MKKLICLFLAILLITTTIPFATATATQDFIYKVVDEEAILIDYTGDATQLNIPHTLGGYPVTTIGPWTFADCQNLSAVTIGENITTIGFRAFYSCPNLDTITVDQNNPTYTDSNGVLFTKDQTTLMYYPQGKTATTYAIPQSVKTIGHSAFSFCQNLKTITIPTGVTTIEDFAFSSCSNLNKVTLPKGIKTIGTAVFENCESLTEMTIPSGVTSIGASAFSSCTKLTQVEIPYTVTTIENYAFYNCKNLKSITIPNSVTTIGKGAFGCYYDENLRKYVPIDGFVVYGYNPSAAKTFAQGIGIRFVVAKHEHSYKTTTTKATLWQYGKITKKCTICQKATITPIPLPERFTLSTTSYVYNGKVKTPTVTVKDAAGKTLKKNTDYTVTYQSGRKLVGTYKVTVKMKGKYSGTKTLTFKIIPSATPVSSLVKGTKKITVNIKKKATQITGYQVQYATSKKFTDAKTKTVSSYKTTKVTLSGLKAKTTYYVRVRVYKKVSGKTYYSGWSTYKYTKTK
jgi:hypothetical protein